MICANGGLPAHRYTPQVTQRWPRGSEPASVILRKTEQDVYVIQAVSNKTVEQDHAQLLLREQDPHDRAVTFEFTTGASYSDNDLDEDEYTAERIISDKPDASLPG